MPARDADGCIRILDAGGVPIPKDVLEIHEEKLRRRAERERVAYGPDLAVSSVYEMSESMKSLLPDTWAVAQ